MSAQRVDPRIQSTIDVVAFLRRQHEEIKSLFVQVLASEGAARGDAFFALRRLMAIHEIVEQEVVHPAARATRGIGEGEVDRRVREENQATIALASLETLDVDATEFEIEFRALQSAVLAHAAAEEAGEFERLSNEFDEAQLVRVRKAERLADSLAPEPSNPDSESTAPVFVGPFARLIDRTRDLIGRRDADVRIPM